MRVRLSRKFRLPWVWLCRGVSFQVSTRGSGFCLRPRIGWVNATGRKECPKPENVVKVAWLVACIITCTHRSLPHAVSFNFASLLSIVNLLPVNWIQFNLSPANQLQKFKLAWVMDRKAVVWSPRKTMSGSFPSDMLMRCWCYNDTIHLYYIKIYINKSIINNII